MSKKEILLLFSPILVFLGILFTDFFLEQGIISRQKFWSKMKKFFFVGTSPYKFRSSTPPPPGGFHTKFKPRNIAKVISPKI